MEMEPWSGIMVTGLPGTGTGIKGTDLVYITGLMVISIWDILKIYTLVSYSPKTISLG